MLARAVGREREISTRLSIGASRWRVVRQLLTESIILAVVASVAGILVATWGTSLLIATVFPLHLDLSVDWRVFVVSAALALGSGLLFGLAPALHATRRDVATALRAAATGGGERKARLQGGLVVAQVALSLMLLTMSGLFIRALDKARHIDVGFDASPRVLALSYDLGLQRYDSARTEAFNAQLMAGVRSLPGVESVTATDLLPLTEWSAAPVVTELAGKRSGESPNEDRESKLASISAVGVEYFRTIDTPILAGRSFSDGDRTGALRVAIVSEGFARQRFGNTSPIGGRVRMAMGDSSWWTIVGVARDAVIQSLQAPPTGAIYFPLLQRPSPSLSVLVRTTGANASMLERAVRAQVRALDPSLPIRRLTTLDLVRDAATSEQRAGATVLAIFGALALALASLGLHAVLVFLVRQRTREIGIRMALGASRRAVTTMVVRRGLQLTAIGVMIGVILALGVTQLTRSLLFGISPTDGWTFVATATLFVGVATLACWLPARRAARVDPVMAIRAE
jgi:predicted permease